MNEQAGVTVGSADRANNADSARLHVPICQLVIPVVPHEGHAVVRGSALQVHGGRYRSSMARAKYRMHNGFQCRIVRAGKKRNPDVLRRVGLPRHASLMLRDDDCQAPPFNVCRPSHAKAYEIPGMMILPLVAVPIADTFTSRSCPGNPLPNQPSCFRVRCVASEKLRLRAPKSSPTPANAAPDDQQPCRRNAASSESAEVSGCGSQDCSGPEAFSLEQYT